MDTRNRVLIVEDDPACGAILGRIVKSLDPQARVDQATSAEAAAHSYVEERGKGAPYNLVIADVFLEGKLTGVDLWKFYRRFDPPPPVVLMSSLPYSRFLETTGESRDAPPYLQKPFFAEECRRILRHFLASM